MSVTSNSKQAVLEPFDFQIECIEAIYDLWRHKRQRVVLIAGCGAGKTFMAGLLLRNVTQFSKFQRRCLFLVDRNNLLNQAANEIRELGCHCTIFQGDRDVDWSAPIIIVSCATLEARIRGSGLEAPHVFSQLFGRVDVIIPDECHDVCWRDLYLQLEAYYVPQGTRILGLTATPGRTKQNEYLGQRFDEAVCAPQPPELVAINRIVTCRSFGYDEEFDYQKLRIGRDGDYDNSDLEKQALRPGALNLIVEKWLEKGQNRPTVAFCPTVKHAEKLAETFQRAGVPADWQDGSTPTRNRDWQKGETRFKTREDQDEDLVNGTLKVVCSVNTQVKGWNLKAIGCIIFTYPTLSKSRFHQAAGRGSRADKDKLYYILLDFGGNTERHGSPTGYQDYSIGPKPEKKIKAVSTKQCPNCNLISSIFVAICPECEYVFSIPEKPAPVEDNLLDIPLIEILSPLERQQIDLFRRAKQICYENHASPDKAINQFYEKFGFEPYSEWHHQAVLGGKYSDGEKRRFLNYLKEHAPPIHTDHWLAINIHLEFGDHNGQPLESTTQRTYPGWWEILDIPETASFEQIETAYIVLSQPWRTQIARNIDTPFRLKQLNWARTEAIASLQRRAHI